MAQETDRPRWIKVLDAVLLAIALIGGGTTLAFMVFFGTLNVVVMRKALNAPIQGAEDLLILSLVMLVAFAIPFGGRTGSHIEIEIFESRMSPSFAHWSMLVLKLIGGALLIVMAYQLIHAGQKATRFGETTQQLLISFEPFYYLLAISVGLYVLVLISDVFQLWKFGKISQLTWGTSS